MIKAHCKYGFWEFDELKTIDQNIVAQIIIMLVLINMVLNVKQY